jgi:multiple sugar transport system ATP-binding protein
MAAITFSGVGKVYSDGTRAVDDLNLEVQDGEFMVFVGPSGCGKTTALRMVAGLEEITEGEITIGNEVVNLVEPRKRDAAMVFQNYALYPHMSIFENIAFPLRSRRLPKAEINKRVETTAAMLGLTEHLKRRPRNLSGGQRQRVAMGRALVREPKVFLMDEPLSNLDAKLRVQMRAEITRLQQEIGVTTIYVTHDQIEAMTMGSRIAILRKGVLQQEGPPQDLYDRPANLFVATFIGSPGMNLFKARLRENGAGLLARIGDQELLLPPQTMAKHTSLAGYRNREVVLGIRPEHFHPPTRLDGPRLRGQVQLVEALGAERLVHLEIAGEPVLTDEVIEIASDLDSAVVESLKHEAEAHRVPVVARFDAKSKAHAGDSVEIAIDAEEICFFDLEGGRAIA